jgi:hypothetical protein
LFYLLWENGIQGKCWRLFAVYLWWCFE